MFLLEYRESAGFRQSGMLFSGGAAFYLALQGAISSRHFASPEAFGLRLAWTSSKGRAGIQRGLMSHFAAKREFQ